MRRIILTLILAAVPYASLIAQSTYRPKYTLDPKPKEWTFIGYSFTRTTVSNVTPMNDVLQGQVIGRLFGSNSTSTVPRAAFYTEQRFVPFIVYTPSILDGYATFRTLMKIDYTFGDQSYGIGNNRGGGLSGGQVNLQTLMANVEIRPPDKGWNAVVGLQRMFDNALDPNTNTLEIAQTTGYKLSFWGTQAVGAALFKDVNPTLKMRLGAYQLWENQISMDDDVYLIMGDLKNRASKNWEVGYSLWYLRDTAKNAGGISILGQGLTSALAEYNGAVRLDFRDAGVSTQNYKANLFWTGINTSYNRDFISGPWMADGYAIANVGTIDSIGVETGRIAEVASAAVNAGLHFKYGQTNKDKVWIEGLFTTGDTDGVKDGKVNSILTGNVWGSPVGIYGSHRAFLLFPDAQVVNRYYSAVHDISNMGYGTSAVFLNASKDFIPNKFSGKMGFASAISNVAPPRGGNYIGSEINAEFKYNLKVFLTIGVSGAYMMNGDFYDSPRVRLSDSKPNNPWVIFTSLSWLMF